MNGISVPRDPAMIAENNKYYNTLETDAKLFGLFSLRERSKVTVGKKELQSIHCCCYLPLDVRMLLLVMFAV